MTTPVLVITRGGETQKFVFPDAEVVRLTVQHIFQSRFGLTVDQSEHNAELLVTTSKIFYADYTFELIPFDETEYENIVSEAITPVLTDEIYHYVLMRIDTPDDGLLFGKTNAQSNHAGTAMVLRGLRKNNPALTSLITEWEQEGDGFGTCIVLGVTAAEMRQAVSLASLLGLHAGIVHDPSFPLLDGDKIASLPVDTCAFLIGRKKDCYPVVGRFPLLRDPAKTKDKK